MAFLAVAALVAFLAGAISAVAGLGIGSILTPLLGLAIGVKLAVAAAAIPHFAGNARPSGRSSPYRRPACCLEL